MSTPFLPRLLVLRDPRDGRTIRISLQVRDGRYWLDIDSGDAFDGASSRDRWHPSEAAAVRDLDDLLHRYQRAGYQIFSDSASSLRKQLSRQN
jgi:hypothetical protein